MNLTSEQLEFIKRHFGYDKEHIEIMGREEWNKLREQCFDYTDDILCRLSMGIGEDDPPEDTAIGEEIGEITFAELHK